MDAKTIMIAAVVGGLIFGGVALAPIDHMSGAASGSGGMGRLTSTVDPKFHKVGPDTRTPDQVQADADRTEIQNTLLMGKMMGLREVPVEEMTAAMADAPRHAGYYRYAMLVRSGFRMKDAPEDQVNMHIACFSSMGDGRNWQEGEILHHMVRYDDRALGADTPVSLFEWIHSGCAEAVRTKGRDLNSVQYLMAMRNLLPKTSAFDFQRREIMVRITEDQHGRS